MPTASLVLRDEKAAPTAPPPDRYWVIQRRPGALGHGHQEPGAELRPAGRQRADRHVRLHRQGPQGVPGRSRARSPSAAPDNAQPRSTATRRRTRSTSRSCSTTSSSRRRTSTTARTRTASTARTGAQISGGFTITTAQDLAKILKIGALPIRLELISRSQVSATLGKQALNQGLIAGIAGFLDRRALPARLLPRARRDRGRRAGRLRALLLRAHQADPDHADAAGHRGPDPHAGRGGRREHRHLRAREGGGARGQIRVRGPSPRATRRASRRSSTRTSSRSSSRSSSSSSPRRGSRASRSSSASARSCRCSPRCWRPRRSSSRCAARGSSEHEPRSAPATRKHKITLRLHGRVEVVLLDVRPDPADRRAGDRRQGHQLRHRLRVRHADHRAAEAGRRPSTQVRNVARARRASATRRSRRSTTRSSASTSSRSRPTTLAPKDVGEVNKALSDKLRAARQRPTSSRSARRSARRSPTPR